MSNRTLPLIASCGLAVSGAFAVTAPQAFAEFTSTASVTDNQVTAGSVNVQLVDANGNAASGPLISVTNAAPAMSTQTTTVRVKNNGSLAAAVTLHSANLTDTTTHSLNDVLVATLKGADGSTLYSGSVSGLTKTFANVSPGEQLVLTLELTWPDLPAVDDNPYQDAGLTFTITADAVQVLS